MKNLSTLLVWARVARTNAVCALFALMLLAFASPAAAQDVAINETNFPDATFRQYVKDKFDKNSDNVLSEAELNAATQIGSPTAGSSHRLPVEVADLTGIKLFPKLKTLYATKDNKNAVTSLDVSGITTLTTLQWFYNPSLTSLNVSGCTALTTLYCHANSLTSLNVSGCRSLTKFYCHANKLTGDLDVSGFDKLTTFYCYQNQLTGLDVSGCTALPALYCYENKLTSLDVSGCPALNTLSCYDNLLTTLNISTCQALTTLHCYQNQLTTLNVSTCPALNLLNCYGNELTTLDVRANKALKALNCGKNKLTGLGDVHFDASLLEELHCGENGFTTLDVSGCTALKILNCYGNELTTLDVRSNKALITLSCGKNKFASQDDIHINSSLQNFWCEDSELLKSLDLSGNTTLMQVVCWKCPLLTDVDMSNCPNLVECHVSQNPVLRNLNVSGCPNLKTEHFASFDLPLLHKVDISGCTSLMTFDPGGEFLTILNASGCTSLTRVAYTSGGLTSLNVSGCTALQTLQVSRNQLTSLDLSSLTTLTALSCDGNRLKRLVLPNIDWNKVKWCSSQGNHLPLSVLHGFRTMESYKTLVEKGQSNYPAEGSTTGQIFQDWPQSDTVYLNLNGELDLSSEKELGPDGSKVVTKFEYKWDYSGSPYTTSGDMNTDQEFNKPLQGSSFARLGKYTAASGKFQFTNSGTHEIKLTNTLVKGTGTSEGAARPFTWIVKVGLDSYRDIALQSADAAMGDVTGAGRYAKGAAVRITAPEKPGHRFVNWTHSEGGAVFGTKMDTTFNITENLNLTANFTPVYTIQTQANDVTMGIVRGRGKYIKDANVTLTATPDPAFRFVRWKKGERDVSTESTYTFPATENATFTAEFEWITYTITLLPEGEVAGGGVIRKDSLVNININSKPGHRFLYWNRKVDGKEVLFTTKADTSFRATEDLTLEAKFMPICNITVLPNIPGLGTAEGGGKYDKDEMVRIVAQPTSDNRFVRWERTVGDKVVLFTTRRDTTFKASEDLNLTAVFRPRYTYTITTASGNDLGGSVIGGGTYKEDSLVFIAATTNPGYYFECWQEATTGRVFTKMKEYSFKANDAIFTNPPTNDRTRELSLKAVFKAIPDDAVRVVVRPNGVFMGETTITGDGTYKPGTEVTISAKAKEGYRFTAWRNGTEVFATVVDTTFTVGENMILTAYFRNVPPHRILVKSSNDQWGEVKGGGEKIPENAEVTIEATPKEGYRFMKWTSLEYTGENEPEEVEFATTEKCTFTALRDLTLTAVFDKNPGRMVSVRANNPNFGDVSGSGVYESNAQAYIKATPKEGYRFVHWKYDGGDVFAYVADTMFVVTANIDLVAYFEAIPTYNITLQTNYAKWGEVKGGGVYYENTQVTISATPNEGYRFAKWKNGNADFGFSADTTFMVLENMTLTAYFEEIPVVEDPSYTITVRANDGTLGSALLDIGISSAIYKKDADVTIVAKPTGAKSFFVKWTSLDADGTETEFSTEATYTFKAFDNLVLTACFDLRESDELGLYVKDRVIYLPEPMGKVQVFSTMGQFLYEGEGMAFRMARSGVFVLRIKGKNYKVLVP